MQLEATKKDPFHFAKPSSSQARYADNILYGNEEYIRSLDRSSAKSFTTTALKLAYPLRGRTRGKVATSGDALSLGQKQLIAFMRAVLRDPDLSHSGRGNGTSMTVTEQILEDILKKLPKHTTRVIIAHRLNTIENAKRSSS